MLECAYHLLQGASANLVLDYDLEGGLARYSTGSRISYATYLYNGVNYIYWPWG